MHAAPPAPGLHSGTSSGAVQGGRLLPLRPQRVSSGRGGAGTGMPVKPGGASLRDSSSSSDSYLAVQQGSRFERPSVRLSRTRSHLQGPLLGVKAFRCASVHSTTSATTHEVSSFLPPGPIGACGSFPLGPSRVFSWQAWTMASARWLSCASDTGPCWPGRSTVLQRSAISSRKRLSKTPSLPITTMSPSYADTQCTALPFSMTSMVISSWNSGSILSSTLASCRGVCACPSMRCISVWQITCNGWLLPCTLRRMTSSQSPMETMAIMGCGLPWMRLLLSMMASTTVSEPRLSVASKARLMNGMGPRYVSCGARSLPGRSWIMPSSSQTFSSSFGSREASMPKSSICETPSATPTTMGDSSLASASLCPFKACAGCVFW
mmetsp:Transcript_104128/g.323744  ORF Transcript_104128/g.323744 Transcript_104128/m.323744 type:complete len:379 (+) Transcript_104128:299-1435(+)